MSEEFVYAIATPYCSNTPQLYRALVVKRTAKQVKIQCEGQAARAFRYRSTFQPCEISGSPEAALYSWRNECRQALDSHLNSARLLEEQLACDIKPAWEP